MHLIPRTATAAWLNTLSDVLSYGGVVSPRGKETVEVLQHSICVDLLRPVVIAPSRKLSQKFLGAEAFWMLTGDDRVRTIAPYNQNISQFSDDGVTFYGAYGPRIHDQIGYVVNKLVEDRDTRQAGLTTWRKNPPATKDVPCTIAMFFSIRDGMLNSHVFMRSSDAWLGVPYDVFNFSMVALLVACRLNARADAEGKPRVVPGNLFLTSASRHLYKENWVPAQRVLEVESGKTNEPPVPGILWHDEKRLLATLDAIREGVDEARWWSQPR